MFHFRQTDSKNLLSAITSILLGIILFFCKDQVLGIAGILFSLVFMLLGAALLASYYLHWITNGYTIMVGCAIFVLGLWFLMNPGIVVSMIPAIIGFFLIVHSLRSLISALQSGASRDSLGILALVISIVGLLLGILCITDAFGIMEKALQLVGILLVLNGIASLVLSRPGSGDQTGKDDGYIDVTFKD